MRIAGDGWADVWKKGCFGWENKKPKRDLKAALVQLVNYAPNLDNPPLLALLPQLNPDFANFAPDWLHNLLIF